LAPAEPAAKLRYSRVHGSGASRRWRGQQA
jgi:hypothetical protein